MKKKNKEKINTILYCEQVLKSAEKQAEFDSISVIDDFQKVRKHKFRRLQGLKEGEHFDYAAFKREMAKEIDFLEDNLMGVELKLQEAIQDSTSNFFNRVEKIVEEMKNKTGQFTKEVQDEMEQFSVALKAYALQEFEKFANSSDDIVDQNGEGLSNEFISVMSDNEVLNQHLEQSKENIDQQIQNIDSKITLALKNEWTSTQARIIEEQYQRNRTIV